MNRKIYCVADFILFIIENNCSINKQDVYIIYYNIKVIYNFKDINIYFTNSYCLPSDGHVWCRFILFERKNSLFITTEEYYDATNTYLSNSCNETEISWSTLHTFLKKYFTDCCTTRNMYNKILYVDYKGSHKMLKSAIRDLAPLVRINLKGLILSKYWKKKSMNVLKE